MLEIIICCSIFGIGAILGAIVAVSYEAHNGDGYSMKSETELEWKLMMDENKRLLKESLEH